MKKIKNLLIALFAFLTVSSFAAPITYTVTKGVTTNVTCMVGDTLKFYGTVPATYAIQINGVTTVTPHACPSPFYIGYRVVTASDNSFTILGSPNWSGTITVQTATSVKDFTKNTTANLVAFPNPNNGEFKIKFNTNKEKTDVVIYDIQGRLVFQENANTILGENTLDINTNFASGIYIVKVEDRTFKVTVTK